MNETTPKTREDEPESYVQDVQLAEYMANAEKWPREKSIAHRKIAKVAFDKHIEGAYTKGSYMSKRELERSLGLKPSEHLEDNETESDDLRTLRSALEAVTTPGKLDGTYVDDYNPGNNDGLDTEIVGRASKKLAQDQVEFAKYLSDDSRKRYEEVDPKSLDAIK